MATATDLVEPLAHTKIELPPPPSPSYWSESQWAIWYAIADTVMPSIVASSSTASDTQHQVSQDQLDQAYAELLRRQSSTSLSRSDFEAYLAERCVESQDFRDNMTRTMNGFPDNAKKQLGFMLTALSTRLGSYALTGHFQPFNQLKPEERAKVLQSWQASSLTALRAFEKSASALCKRGWIQTSPQWARLSGWTDLPADYKPAKAADYKFRQFSSGAGSSSPDGTVTLETDVVIVGSGCGGGVSAKILAEAGHRVTVVDKGYYFPPSSLPMRSDVGEYHLFESHGLLATNDGSMTVLAGSTWGGGGTVNWGVSLRTPDYVREGWVRERGLPLFGDQRYDDAMDRVCGFMGVSDARVRQSARGQALLDGCEKLGWKAKPTPHNSGHYQDQEGGEDHHCGHCHLGCASSGKQGPAVSWLPAAARAGAEFVEGFQADRVLFEEFAGSGARAVGVEGKWVSRDRQGKTIGPTEERLVKKVVIKAKRVIVAGGSISSPVLLKKSGMGNPHIGRNLYLHPVQSVAGFWAEDRKPWDGCAITSVCTAFEDLDNRGNGFKLEPLSMVPYLVCSPLPWRSALDFRLAALRYRHMGVYFSMPRDRDTGRVYPDPATGDPRVDYVVSDFDRAHALEGVLALARICYASNAEEIRAYLPGTEPFIRTEGSGDGEDDARFEKWLDEVKAVGNPLTSAWGGAHQMGSCRMSKSADEGVVDMQGKAWGFEGLYVADSSVFPSASGVNPMVTTMAIADVIARGVAEDLNALKRKV